MTNRNIDFKIAVFDLDYTLWDGTKLFSDTVDILKTLKQKGIPLYIASFHTDALNVCKDLQIDHFFQRVLYGIDRTKLDMIRDILSDHTTVSESDTVFFDDNYENIQLVKKESSVRCVHIPEGGITWYHITITCNNLYKFVGEIYKKVEPVALYETDWLRPNIDFFDNVGFHLDNFALLAKMSLK
jgi:soluble P-type ATPase